MADEEKIRIAMVLFPNMTALDLVGPYEVLGNPRASVELLWHRVEPVPTTGSLALMPTATFDSYQVPPDVLFVPGGPGQLAAIDDEALIRFVTTAAKGARYITSVCTGSLILAAAGLLKGKRATTHWASHDQLALFGAIPVDERVVTDGNIVTGAGVTSGIDFGLVLAARLWGEQVAKAIQLTIEYDPEPPLPGGSPKSAEPGIIAAARERLAPLIEKRKAAARRIAKDRLGLGG
jgi:cyclohexyl-isocyanide hydratase